MRLFFQTMLCLLLLSGTSLFADDRPRLMILTDIGGDPDDRQSMIRLMVFSNEFRIEGFIATASGTPGELKKAITQPHLIREIVEAYGQVRPNLQKHAEGWPETTDLIAVIKSGNPQRGLKNIGAGHDTEGSQYIIQRVDAGTAEDPLNICIWGGQSDLAQALWRVKQDRGEEGFAQFTKKFRVYDIADQDRIADWMQQQFPGLFYILSKNRPGKDSRTAAFRGMYITGDESLTSKEWINENIRNHRTLGELYPTRTSTLPNKYGCMKEGDTPSWFFFLPMGGNNPNDPSQPGWGGQFRKTESGWYRDDQPDIDIRESVARWRPEFQAEFAKRMSWTTGEK
ncbi:hypothetical protein Pla110_17270 [Polystyrenella longa]|uniref:Cellulose-binding Sde182 nucleoside hydrolase-like domain-containing protein n=1 Tax=Polystyrenella longa TaxID=2528007 RepID=A0A518CLA4_9PLAN|nr:DUF1593 domain-containing protein [Polystyrenella longa]QDU80005.1 hypothetical protein Pla110_17270 [Polystyrenella longa]